MYTRHGDPDFNLEAQLLTLCIYKKMAEFKNKDLHVQCQRVGLNMYACLKKENSEMSDNAVIARIHELTKIGLTTIYKYCSLNTPCSREKRVINLHAGSKDGFVPNALLLTAKNITKPSADYHEDMTADLFEKWFVEQLLPNIPPNSVIVMKNASYYSLILNKIPNNSTKKDEILKFMKIKNINIPEKIPVKNELINIIKSRNFQNEYVIDTICSRSGHTLLRLPPYYCIFNPIEMVWGTLLEVCAAQSRPETQIAIGPARPVNALTKGVVRLVQACPTRALGAGAHRCCTSQHRCLSTTSPINGEKTGH
ncbi:hypothetical protein NQ318_014408 [Aromia moschata]|uniref:Uncharacterized protein n=1 Tax=Aromia moschata TaxID=1265417 RepID=A0AAV8YCG8_9CUCU|nr:hypothetical protein NQ318_014408 [Aromia moschata]